jgi:hypothetical protein
MPAWGNFVLDKGMNAAAAISKFRAVKLTAEETVGPITGLGDMVIGVAQFGVTAGEILKGKGCSFRCMGVTEMEADGAIAVGAPVGITADGRASATIAVGTRRIGVCVKGAGGAGQRASVFLNIPGPLHVAGM